MKEYNKRFHIDQEILAAVPFYSEDSIIITDTMLDSPGPHIVYVNPGFTKMTGYEPEEVLGKSPRFLQGKDTDQQVLQHLRRCLEEQKVFHGLAINYRKDGTPFYNEWHIEPILNDEMKLVYYMAIQRDATNRVKDSQAIEQKNAALREVLEQIQIEKKKIKDDVLMNVKEVLLPAIEKLKRKGTKYDRKFLDILEQNLNDMTSSFATVISQKKMSLSPRETEICNLIRNGLSSKEICELLNISYKTIETHRAKIRTKLGLVNKDINLTTYIQSI